MCSESGFVVLFGSGLLCANRRAADAVAAPSSSTRVNPVPVPTVLTWTDLSLVAGNVGEHDTR